MSYIYTSVGRAGITTAYDELQRRTLNRGQVTLSGEIRFVLPSSTRAFQQDRESVCREQTTADDKQRARFSYFSYVKSVNSEKTMPKHHETVLKPQHPSSMIL